LSLKTKKQKNLKSNDSNQVDFIVGLGASAGGLEALKSFFRNLSPLENTAYVVVVHLSPDYESLMGELLSKITDLPVLEVKNDVEVKPNTIYVIPRKHMLVIKNKHLKLSDKNKKPQDIFPIDLFFDSLAREMKEKAIGVIFSGTGSDGSRGIKTIKENGGVVIVQDPTQSQFNGMPNTAISTNCVDIVATAEKIPSYVESYVKTSDVNNLKEDHDVFTSNKDRNDVLAAIKQKTQIDFSFYKESTVMRRIRRRMHLLSILSFHQYVDYLSKHNKEIVELQQDLLIGVTQFFRDDETFTYFNEHIVPKLFEKKNDYETIRIWDVACSTGEEAYSLGMLVHHYADLHDIKNPIKIFATDVNDLAIQTASEGLYPANIAAEIDPLLLRTYFTKEGHYYRVSKSIRKMIVFATHNILLDPPFNKIDLLVCRNMLIYFNLEAQKKTLSSFHYVLNESGFLFLGDSEAVSGFESYFSQLNKQVKIFKKVNKAMDFRLKPTFVFNEKSLIKDNSISNVLEDSSSITRSLLFRDRILESMNVAAAIISEKGDYCFLTSKFKLLLTIPDTPSICIFKLLPKSLSIPITNAVMKVKKSKMPVMVEGISLVTDENHFIFNVNVSLFDVKTTRENSLFLVLVKLVGDEQSKTIEPHYSFSLQDATSEHIRGLEYELDEARTNLQQTIEELETSNEELQTTNEELISTNEELQSTNEELQSVNEELYTVNSEYQEKIKQLSELHDDLDNLLTSTEIGTIILDKSFFIRRITPMIELHFNIRPSDIGRSLHDFSSNLDYPHLERDFNNVFKSLKPVEREIFNSKSKTWFLMRVQPYRSGRDSIDGIVVTFVDIYEQKAANESLKRLTEELTSQKELWKTLIQNINLGVFLVGEDGQIYRSNKIGAVMLDLTEVDIDNRSFFDLFPEDISSLFRDSNSNVFHGGSQLVTFSRGEKDLYLDVTAVFLTVQGEKRFLFSIQDITQPKSQENIIQDLNKIKSFILESTLSGYWDWDIPGEYEYMSPSLKKMLGYEDHEVPNTPAWWQDNIHPDDLKKVLESFDEHIKTKGESPYDNEVRYTHKNGETVWVICRGKVIEWDSKGQPLRMVGSHVDITALKKQEEKLKVSERNFKRLYNETPLMLHTINRKGVILDVNQSWLEKMGYTQDEVIGKKSVSFLEKSDRQRAKKLISTMLDSKSLERVPLQFVTKSGEILHVTLSAKSNGKSGDQEMFDAALLDVTEEVKTRQQLEISEQRFEDAFKYSSIGIAMVGLDGSWLQVNESLCSFLGYSREELQSKTFQDITYPDDLSTDLDYVQRLVAGEISNYQMEKRYFHKDGSIVWALLSVSLVRASSGDPLYFVSQIQDINERKNNYNNLLMQKQKLEVANTRLEEFSYIATHDLKAPLVNLMSIIKHIDKDEQGNEKNKVLLDKMETVVNTMNRTLSDLLEMASMSKTIEDLSDDLTLKQVFFDVKKDFEDQLNDIDAKVTTSFRSGNAIRYPLVHLKSFFQNLLSNAIKYRAPNRPLHITVSTRKEGEYHCISFSDNGLGIDLAYYKDNIFKMFKRAHTHVDGKGLGLYLVKSQVEALNGKVDVTSEVNKGTTFTLFLKSQNG